MTDPQIIFFGLICGALDWPLEIHLNNCLPENEHSEQGNCRTEFLASERCQGVFCLLLLIDSSGGLQWLGIPFEICRLSHNSERYPVHPEGALIPSSLSLWSFSPSSLAKFLLLAVCYPGWGIFPSISYMCRLCMHGSSFLAISMAGVFEILEFRLEDSRFEVV